MAIKRDSNTKSPWQLSATPPKQANILKFEEFDVIIVGGGITGITTALLLQQQGKKCIVLEGHTIGYGTTGGTTAHINTFFDATYAQIDNDFGKNGASLVAQAGNAAIEAIKIFTKDFNIDCQLEVKTGYLFSQDENQNTELQQILASSLQAGVEVKQAEENGVQIPFLNSLAFAGQYQFHPLNYTFGLAEQFLSLGGQIREHSFVREVITEGAIHTVKTDVQSFKSSSLVYATHIPPGVNQFSFRCAPYRSYVLGITLADGEYPQSMVYDMQEPYHYIRTHEINGENLLIIGGADHKTGHEDPEKAFKDLETYAKQYFKIKTIAYKWSSQYYVPVDGLPYIGPMNNEEDTIYVATGFNGNGMTWGTISALIISDQILKKHNRYADIFKPNRIKPVAGFSDFVKENSDVVYHFLADRFRITHLDSLTELNNEEGRVVKMDGNKIAVYRDASGMLAALNPTCTHAGCTVCFNPAEKSWDCPCHGGRFDLRGKVISGPARKDLAVVDLTKDATYES